MKITKHNYESYFIDYFDGNLDKKKQEELFLFLNNNPLLKAEFNEFEHIRIKPRKEIFPLKSALKKKDNAYIYGISEKDYLAIAALEKDLTDDEKISLEQYLHKIPELSAEIKLFEKTKLQADLNIIFKHKNRIKRTVLPVSIIRNTLAAAAAITAFVFVIGRLGNISQSNNAALSLKLNDNYGVKNSILFAQPYKSIKISKKINNKAFSVSNNNNIKQTENSDTFSIKSENLQNFISAPEKPQRITNSESMNLTVSKIKIQKAKESNITKNINLWQIAESGVKTWNTITSSDALLKNKYNEKGKIENISFSYKTLKISKTFNKN